MKHLNLLFPAIFFVSLFFSEPSFSQNKLALEKLIQLDDIVWGIDFIDTNNMIFTLRSGKIGILNVKNKKLSWVEHKLPVQNVGQGGLLDVRVSPNFLKDRLVYLTYSIKLSSKYTLAASYAKLIEANSNTENKTYRLEDNQEFFQAQPASKETIHFGGRLDFEDSTKLFLTSGERNERNQVQDLKSDLGKILKFELSEGKPNKKSVYSYGHRNPQGIFYDPITKQIWVTEHGPRGGDELNLIQENRNYGWPEYTNGREYWGPKIGKGPEGEGITKATIDWTPSIAPSALIFYRGSFYPELKDSFLVAILKDQHIRQIKLNSDNSFSQNQLFAEMGLRFRSIRANSDGKIYLGTDSGQIFSLIYAASPR